MINVRRSAGGPALPAALPPTPNLLLALLLLTQFLVVLLDVDATLALPAIQRDLGSPAPTSSGCRPRT